MPKRTLYWISGVLVALFLFGNQGFRQLVEESREKRHLGGKLAFLEAEHTRLAQELELIQKEPSYTEYLIRKYLGYVKKGEVEYRIWAAPKAQSASAQ